MPNSISPSLPLSFSLSLRLGHHNNQTLGGLALDRDCSENRPLSIGKRWERIGEQFLRRKKFAIQKQSYPSSFLSLFLYFAFLFMFLAFIEGEYAASRGRLISNELFIWLEQ